MNRREFLQTGLAAAAAPQAAQRLTAAVTPTGGVAPAKLARIDTNVTLFPWPGRRLPHDELPSLLGVLERHGITQAWVGTFEGILQRDVRSVNARLAEACRASGGRCLGFGSVNPTLPDWEEDLRRCHEVHRMPGVRINPNYHGYTLADPLFQRLLALAAERRMLVQIVCLIEDTRTQNPLLRVPDVDLAPLPEVLKAVPSARVLLLNAGKFVDAPVFRPLAQLPQVTVETARVEGVGGVGRLARRLDPGRVVFGSHAPFFIYESAVIKLFESNLTEAEIRTLVDEGPRRLLGG